MFTTPWWLSMKDVHETSVGTWLLIGNLASVEIDGCWVYCRTLPYRSGCHLRLDVISQQT